MSDFDAELALMHGAADSVFADDGYFRPASGAAVPCKIERARPELAFGLNEAKAVVGEEVFRVLKASLPRRPAKNDIFEVGTVDWVVLASAEIEDDDGLRYSVKVERA